MRYPERLRRRGAAPSELRWNGASSPWDDYAGPDDGPHEPTALHALRLQAVHDTLRASGARRVADLGCGDGALVHRLLADTTIEHVVALDRSLPALWRLERTVPPEALRSGRLTLVQGSFADRLAELQPVDAAAMVETIEHVAPARLSAVEQQVFRILRPCTVVVTTPNQEFNERFGMAPGQMREPGHHFEWTRQRLRAWAQGVAQRQGYGLDIVGIGEVDPHRGSPTQMAVFSRSAA